VTISRIYVNQRLIRSNVSSGLDEPPLTVKEGKARRFAHEAIIRGTDGTVVAKIVYTGEAMSSGGARCWVETELPVEVTRR
jgi:hypothetical protein